MRMDTMWWVIFVVAVLVGLLGDVCMKTAGVGGGVRIPWLIAGFTAYSATGFGWFWLLRSTKLSAFGTIYPLANAIGLLAIGGLAFHETITPRQWGGFAVGCAALWLLSE